jgi:hypothetical protein
MHRKSTGSNKKRLAIVAAIGAACLATAGVYATTLVVTANQDAAGIDAVATCDAGGVTVTSGVPVYSDTLTSPTVGGFVIPDVTVAGISMACNDSVLYLTPVSNDGTHVKLGETLTWTIADLTAVPGVDKHQFTGLADTVPSQLLGTWAVAIQGPHAA